ncbi:hypothetical protein [Embleya sp. AB8]|uniref:hypothetical protein n=1 Tax=Embleya sp. AB8 TaxID=3156304 RepID=UPI003C785AE5
MKDTALHPVAADYRVEVARILGDLPVVEAEEILDDVEVNLTEVVGELGELGAAVTSESLRARLGTPHEYAAELRAAAGYPTPAPAGSGRLTRFGKVELLLVGLLLAMGATFVTGVAMGLEQDASGRWWVFPCLLGLVVEAVNALWLRGRAPGLPEVAALSITRRARALGESLRTGRWAEPVRFLIGLQSAWWVLRALVVGMFVWVQRGGLWEPVGAGAVALVGSLWLASRSARDRRLLWAVLPVNALVVGLAIGIVGSGRLGPSGHGNGRTAQESYSITNSPVYVGSVDGRAADGGGLLGTMDGKRLENVYPFDAQGRPLTGVLLFDQNGKQLGLADGDNDRACGLGPQQERLIPNRTKLPFPQPRVVLSPNGTACRVEEGAAPFTIAIPLQPGQAPGTNPPASAAPPAGAPAGQGVPSTAPSGAGSAAPVNPPGSVTPADPKAGGPKAGESGGVTGGSGGVAGGSGAPAAPGAPASSGS